MTVYIYIYIFRLDFSLKQDDKTTKTKRGEKTKRIRLFQETNSAETYNDIESNVQTKTKVYLIR